MGFFSYFFRSKPGQPPRKIRNYNTYTDLRHHNMSNNDREFGTSSFLEGFVFGGFGITALLNGYILFGTACTGLGIFAVAFGGYLIYREGQEYVSPEYEEYFCRNNNEESDSSSDEDDLGYAFEPSTDTINNALQASHPSSSRSLLVEELEEQAPRLPMMTFLSRRNPNPSNSGWEYQPRILPRPQQ